jgi:plasmid maintenance system antidote protein VapI
MKAQEKEEKAQIRFRYAVGLYKALQDSSLRSFRKLAKEAGMEPAHIQKISAGKLDVTLTTSIALAKALGISYTVLSAYYDGVTEKDTQAFIQNMEKQKKTRGKEKNKD